MSAVVETSNEHVKFNPTTKQDSAKNINRNNNVPDSASSKSSNVPTSTNLNKKTISNKARDYRLKSDTQQSILPFFLQHREVIQKQLRVEVTRKFTTNQSVHNSNKITISQSPSQLLPCYALYPPSSPFTTLSKRFPYDQPHRATTSVQEIRKKILAADDFASIKSLLLPIKFSENGQNQETQSKNIQNEDIPKENGNTVSKNNQENMKEITPAPTSLDFPVGGISSIEADKSSPKLNNNNNTTSDVAIGMSPILQQLKKNSSQLNHKLDSNEEVSSPLVNRPKSSHSNDEQPHKQQGNNPSILKTSTVSVTTKKSNQLRVSILHNNNNINNNPNNISSKYLSHEAQAFMSDSFLQNEINKWEIKRTKYTKNQAKLKKAIDSKVQDILEEKGNKPTVMATTFIKDLKGIDQELQLHSSEYTLEQKRYTDRLRQFHIKKYELYHSEVKLHTAQLKHPCHQENQININNNHSNEQRNININNIHSNLSVSQQKSRQLVPSGQSQLNLKK